MAGEIEKAQAAKAAVEASLAKAREAQKKFEEAKKQVEEAKRKVEDAVRKAKALQQKILETQALFQAARGVKGGIAAIVANQVGSLRGVLISQVQKQVLIILSKFANECPNAKALEKIIKIRSTLLKHLSGFEQRVGKFSGTASKLTGTVRTVQAVIKIITSIPIPTAIIPYGGGIGIPVSVLTRYSNALVKLNGTLDRLSGEAQGIVGIIDTVNPIITNAKNRLNSIDLVIEQCSQGEPADLSSILATAQPPENTGSEGTPNSDYLYKNFVLAIIEDLNSPKIAPRRYAIAKDRGGTIRLRGESSFSSDTQVLLDELKFKIDNQFT